MFKPKHVDRVVQEKRQKKLVPFTITEIQDINEWRKLQADKEVAFQAKKAENFSRNRLRAIEIINGSHEDAVKLIKADKNYQVMERFKRDQAESRKRLKAVPTIVPPSLLSRWTRVKLWIAKTFLNLDFGQ